MFQYVLQYKPEVLQLETPLKPFIPDYVPAVGDIDEFIKVGRSSMSCISSCSADCITFVVDSQDSVTMTQSVQSTLSEMHMPTCPVFITVSCFHSTVNCKSDRATALMMTQ